MFVALGKGGREREGWGWWDKGRELWGEGCGGGGWGGGWRGRGWLWEKRSSERDSEVAGWLRSWKQKVLTAAEKTQCLLQCWVCLATCSRRWTQHCETILRLSVCLFVCLRTHQTKCSLTHGAQVSPICDASHSHTAGFEPKPQAAEQSGWQIRDTVRRVDGNTEGALIDIRRTPFESHTHTHTQTRAHTHTHTHTHHTTPHHTTHTGTHARTHAGRQAGRHARTHARTHAHTHTHTHTFTSLALETVENVRDKRKRKGESWAVTRGKTKFEHVAQRRGGCSRKLFPRDASHTSCIL